MKLVGDVMVLSLTPKEGQYTLLEATYRRAGNPSVAKADSLADLLSVAWVPTARCTLSQVPDTLPEIDLSQRIGAVPKTPDIFLVVNGANEFEINHAQALTLGRLQRGIDDVFMSRPARGLWLVRGPKATAHDMAVVVDSLRASPRTGFNFFMCSAA